MATCREIFTFTWPLRGRGGQPKRSAWPLFHSFFWRLPLEKIARMANAAQCHSQSSWIQLLNCQNYNQEMLLHLKTTKSLEYGKWETTTSLEHRKCLETSPCICRKSYAAMNVHELDVGTKRISTFWFQIIFGNLTQPGDKVLKHFINLRFLRVLLCKPLPHFIMLRFCHLEINVEILHHLLIYVGVARNIWQTASTRLQHLATPGDIASPFDIYRCG